MSIPHILFTASGSSGPSAASNDLKKLQSTNSLTAKDNIRERLNMHVKKRIQGHDIIGQYPISQYSMPATSGSSIYTSSASTLKQTHPFLMTGASGTMPPVMMFANSLISVASDYSNGGGRTIPIPQIDCHSTSKNKQQPKKLTKKKKTVTNKKKTKQVDAIQQAENLILNTKFSDDSNDFHDRIDNSMNNSILSHENRHNNDSPTIPFDKQDNKLTNTPDILSMVLSLKKNALMHDPYVIQFISAIR